MEQAARHLERFDPCEGEGTLIDTEHRARYWWASCGVADKDVLDAGCGTGYGMEILASAGAATVTGVDIDPDAVGEAESRVGTLAEAILNGDLRDLPFEDDSFDAVVCFETIEHLEDGSRALAELRRVLRPDGLLLISSPNPDVYPAGNEYHVHEYRPDELAAAVSEHFACVERYRQHAWLASAIEPAGESAGRDGRGEPSDLRRTASPEPNGETYGIIAATDEGALPAFAETVVLGDAFEVRWWSQQVEGGKAEGEQAVKEARAHIGRVESEAQRAVAQSAEREKAAAARLRESSVALVDANRELVQVPHLKHRLTVLEEEHERICGLYNEMHESWSWRLTAPLRRLRLLLAVRN